MKRRSQEKTKRIKHPSYSDKVRAGNMMFGGPHPHKRITNKEAKQE